MGCIYRPTRFDEKKGKRVKYRCWRIAYTDENGDRRTEKAFTDRAASEALLRRREVEVERRRAGLLVVRESDVRRKWAEVVDLFIKELTSRGSDPDGKHVTEARRILTRVGCVCDWPTIGSARADDLREYLADMAQQEKAALTRRQHLAFTRNMLNWCVAQGWLAENPVLSVKSPRVGQGGKVRKRRAYTRDELTRLLASTPEPRRSLYLIAALSGFRRKELHLMERQDLNPLTDPPQWHVRPEVAKNKRRDLVPIVPDLLPVLKRVWLKLPSASSRLVRDGLGVAVPRHETLHADLARAKIDRIDDEGRHADFHSFRYTFCRLMGEALPIQTVRVLMRHSTIKLTADLYSAIGIDDLGDAVWSLPCVFTPAESAGGEKDDKTATSTKSRRDPAR